MKRTRLLKTFLGMTCTLFFLSHQACEKTHSPVDNPPPGKQPVYTGFGRNTCPGSGMGIPDKGDALLRTFTFKRMSIPACLVPGGPFT
ncbi:hypothetical protein JW906_00850 [bacterium]|nr:hypothetical protein [bacterium]